MKNVHQVGKRSAGAPCWPQGQAERFDQVHQTSFVDPAEKLLSREGSLEIFYDLS